MIRYFKNGIMFGLGFCLILIIVMGISIIVNADGSNILVTYNGKIDRNNKVTEYEQKGYRMVSDTFDDDWVEGQEPRGTMIFTTEPSTVMVNIGTELDAKLNSILLRTSILETKVQILDATTVKVK